MRIGLSCFVLLVALSLCGSGVAQVSNNTVQWSAALAPKAGEKAALDLSATIAEGWHVYALTQVAGGPTPLQITVEGNDQVQIARAVSGTVPEKRHDPSFDLDTEFYTRQIALHLPLKVKQNATAGHESVQVSIRFQTCSDRTCLPPKTVHFTVPLETHKQS